MGVVLTGEHPDVAVAPGGEPTADPFRARLFGADPGKTRDRENLDVAGVEPEEVPATVSVLPRPRQFARVPVAESSRYLAPEVTT